MPKRDGNSGRNRDRGSDRDRDDGRNRDRDPLRYGESCPEPGHDVDGYRWNRNECHDDRDGYDRTLRLSPSLRLKAVRTR